jgi:hypothetical protein
MIAYRTIFIAVLGFVALVLGYFWSYHDPTLKDLYGVLRDGVVLIVASVATKGLGEALGKGTGIKGALSVLFTDAKAGEEPVSTTTTETSSASSKTVETKP